MTPATFMVKAEVLPMSRKTLMFSPNAAADSLVMSTAHGAAVRRARMTAQA